MRATRGTGKATGGGDEELTGPGTLGSLPGLHCGSGASGQIRDTPWSSFIHYRLSGPILNSFISNKSHHDLRGKARRRRHHKSSHLISFLSFFFPVNFFFFQFYLRSSCGCKGMGSLCPHPLRSRPWAWGGLLPSWAPSGYSCWQLSKGRQGHGPGSG